MTPRRHAIACALASLLLVPLACGPAPAPELVAVSNLLHPPFSSRDGTGRPVGIEVELIEEAARDLGREVRWTERPFSELLGAVVAGEADVAASTLGVTAERARIVAFSEPYFTTSIVALTRPGQGEPRTLDELAGKRVATERGTTAVESTAARIPSAVRVLDRPGGRTWAEMLAAGEIDAVVLDQSHAETFMSEAGERFHLVEQPLREERFALAVRPNDHELLESLDRAVARHLAARSEPR